MKKMTSKKDKREKGLRKESPALKLLLILGSQIKEIGKSFLEFAPDSIWYPDIARQLYTMAPRKMYDSYYSLKRGGYLKEKKTTEKKIIYLTDKGKMEILKNEFWESKKKWDGKWRMIIFDIPEESSHHRDFLRRKLKWFGFKELQKSIWVIPYDAKKEFGEFLKLCNVELKGDVRYITVEKIEPPLAFKEYFGKE